MNEMKRCAQCRETKPLSEFGKMASSKDGLHCWCKSCVRGYNQKYFVDNKESEQARCKIYYQDHIEKERQKTRENRWANIEARRESDRQYGRLHFEERRDYAKIWNRTHRELARAKDRRRYWKNPAKRLEQNKKWAKEHPEITSANNHARRTRIKGNGGRWTAPQWLAMKTHYSPNEECLSCGEIKKLTKDHVIPVISGGTSYISNIQPLCFRCNRIKHIDEIDYRPDGGVYAKWIEENIK